MSKIIVNIAILFAGLFLMGAHASAGVPLRPEDAFVFTAEVEKPALMVAEWHIAPGYYLYRDKVRIVAVPSHPVRIGAIGWPESVGKRDEVRGAFQAYQGGIRVMVPLMKQSHEPLTLVVTYQGCSEDGFCYRPMKKLVHLTFPFAKEGLENAPLLTVSDEAAAGAPDSAGASSRLRSPDEALGRSLDGALAESRAPLTDQTAAKALLGSHTFLMTILSFLGLGLLLAFTPCVLPMVPILSSIIVGQHNGTTRKAFYLSLTYVLGMALTYAAAGMVIASLGSNVQIYFQNPWVIGAFSLLFVLLALSMLGVFDLNLPRAWQQKISHWQGKQQGGTYLGTFLMGSLSTLIVSPCVTAPLVGVLAYVSETGDVLLGAVALFALGLGMGIPLLVIGISAGKFLPKAGPWMEIIKKVFAFLLLGMAIWMLSRLLHEAVTLFLWASLSISVAVSFFFFVDELSKFWRVIGYTLGTFFTLYSFLLFVGISVGATSPLYLVDKWRALADKSSTQTTNFVVVKSVEQLNTLLEEAKQNKKPTLLDFYADWCESCQAMEKTVLHHPDVQQALNDFVLVRVNVTENNEVDQALLERYHVIAPPTFIFINRDGQELTRNRIVGEVDHQLFLARATGI